MTRQADRQRNTKETRIDLSLNIDGSGQVEASTGLPFFDHMLAQLGKHSRFDLRLDCKGDTDIDAHHTVEDVGIALGEALGEALGDKEGVRRFAAITVPLDEAAVEVVLDLSGRPFLHYQIDPPGEKILGDPPFDPQLCEEFWRGLVMASGITLHIVLLRGRNTHHIIEASFKAVARALFDAVRVLDDVMPSTKGVL
ncbi:MAG TPA: imidazoleglycerol-phosphate dehydratase HisB [Acidimicrobiales bacterium]|jgi:imidazoleglycerol-phosphate dehydratase|nr:imidazoleglycerol-phosphate dehydratase HisB [Acidimicrobiales bacterium]